MRAKCSRTPPPPGVPSRRKSAHLPHGADARPKPRRLFGALLIGTIGLAAMPVENQRVIADLETQTLRHRVLALFDAAVHELFHAPAVHTHDVIVMAALVEFEHRHTAFEMMARDEARGLELGQYTIHGGEADILVGNEQFFLNVLGGHMTRRDT